MKMVLCSGRRSREGGGLDNSERSLSRLLGQHAPHFQQWRLEQFNAARGPIHRNNFPRIEKARHRKQFPPTWDKAALHLHT